MKIVTYQDQYYLSVEKLIENFYNESIQCYDVGFSKESIANTITNLKKYNAGNAFLMLVDGKCEGILAGVVMPSFINKKRVFQEVIWYVNEPFRKYGIQLLKDVQAILCTQGYDTMIMGVLENSKTDKLKRLYERMGFKLYESQYIKGL